jgi:hypothetical protein
VSNIYSDVVHFTDGNPGFWFGNIPILWLATREHPKRIKTIEKHEHEWMHLLFARERDMKHYRENQDLWEKNQVQYWIGYMLAEVLRAVHACEIRHIEHVWQFPMDITQWRYSTILNKKTPE